VISNVPVEFSDPALNRAVTAGLALVEQGLLEAASTPHDVLAEASRHLINAGGKRLRPVLVLLAAQFGDPQNERIVPSAVVIELTHLATLYHDDVMDGAAVRRGVPSANARWGNSVAVLTGDFLFARAAQILADLGEDAIRLQARTFSRLVNGQRVETVGPQADDDPLGHYFAVLKDKTASLFAAAGQFGGLLADAPAEVTTRIGRACDAWGVAYQLSDDLLDVASESTQSGKTPGTDLREGIPTLPMLYILRSSRPSDARLVQLLQSGELTDPALHAEALGLLRTHPAMDLARADARRWAGIARTEIRELPDIPARAAFEALCEFVTERTS
jgi:heptaprenyl diphosphate synthase